MDTYNIAPYRVAGAGDTSPLVYGFGEQPTLNFGAAKLIARFTQLLLTLRGSDRTDPGAGCDLLAMVASFHTSELPYLRGEVNNVLAQLTPQMLHENDPAVIPESRFVSAACERVEIDGDAAHIHFVITTASNTKIQFTLPVQI